MVNVTFVQLDGSRITLDEAPGKTVMQAATSNGVQGIIGECGGSLMCATCHVYVAESWLGQLAPVTPVEDEMLKCTDSERRPNSRLGCQITLSAAIDGLVVHVPESQQ